VTEKAIHIYLLVVLVLFVPSSRAIDS